MERRKPQDNLKASPLPADYLKMVTEVFATNFDEGLKNLAKASSAPARFQAGGTIHVNEVLLYVSLLIEGQLAATTVYASADFDPKASSPTVEDLLSACVDAIGGVFQQLLSADNKQQIQNILDESLSSLEDVPYEWTAVEVERRQIFVRIDKANPDLDKMADDWLEKNDPEFEERQKREQEEIEKLFVTGDKAKKNGPLH